MVKMSTAISRSQVALAWAVGDWEGVPHEIELRCGRCKLRLCRGVLGRDHHGDACISWDLIQRDGQHQYVAGTSFLAQLGNETFRCSRCSRITGKQVRYTVTLADQIRAALEALGKPSYTPAQRADFHNPMAYPQIRIKKTRVRLLLGDGLDLPQPASRTQSFIEQLCRERAATLLYADD